MTNKKYKLVPVEPTAEMIEAAREQHEGDAYLPVSLYRAMLAAAPAVQGEQGEPVFMWHRGATDDESEVVDVDCACPCCVPLYTGPQPAPDVASLVEALRDYFAAKAMYAIIGMDSGEYHPAIVAKSAYLMADAMLKERENKP